MFEAGAADPGPGGLACGRAVSDSRSHAGAFWPGRGCGGAGAGTRGACRGSGAGRAGRAGGRAASSTGWVGSTVFPSFWLGPQVCCTGKQHGAERFLSVAR